MWGEGSLHHGERIRHGSTRRAEPVACTYYISKDFFSQAIDLCNYRGWLSKSEATRTSRQERKIPSRVRAHRHSLKLIQGKQGRKVGGGGGFAVKGE